MARLRRDAEELLERRGMAADPGPLSPRLRTSGLLAQRLGQAGLPLPGRPIAKAGAASGAAKQPKAHGHPHRSTPEH